MPPSDPLSAPYGWTPPTPDELDATLPGTYKVTGVLGKGGMGAVYQATQTNLDREVAIKILPLHQSESVAAGKSPSTLSPDTDEAQFAERFKLEAKSMAKLSHPGILSVFDFGETTAGLLYFVMEYSDGTDVVGYLRDNGGKLPEEQAITITSHVLDALSYAHDRNIVHRDIKPANILITGEGQIKIADFGLAKRADVNLGLTMTNMAMGTPDFVAPEALTAGCDTDHRADLYAVGVMLYQMVTGSIPRGRFDDASKIVPGTDPRIDTIIDRAMEADPAKRYQSGAEMRAALDALSEAPVAVVEPDSPMGRTLPGSAKPSGGKSTLIIAAAAAIPLFGILAWLIFKPAPEPQVAAIEPAPNTATAPELPISKPKPEPKPTPKKETPQPSSKPAPKPETTVAKVDGPAPSGPMPKAPEATKPPATPKAPVTNPTPKAESLPPKTPEFTTRHDNYQKALKTQLATLTKSYTGAVSRALDGATTKGDLRAASALRDEATRLKENKPLGEADGDLPPALASLRDTFRTESTKIETSLARDFTRSLRSLEVALTKEKRIDDALAVETWRKSLAPPEPELASAPAPPTPRPEPEPAVIASGPGVLRGNGHLVKGGKPFPLDLSSCAPYSDFVDVLACNLGWMALRANGDAIGLRCVSGNVTPLALSGVAKLIPTTGHFDFYALRADGSIADPKKSINGKIELWVEGTGFVTAAGGFYHHIFLHRDGRAVAIGEAYERGEMLRPPPEATENVRSIAAIRTAAATLSTDGKIHIWNKQKIVELSPSRSESIRKLISGPNSFIAETTDGELRYIVYVDGNWEIQKPGGSARKLRPREIVVGGDMPTNIAVSDGDGKWQLFDEKPEFPEHETINGLTNASRLTFFSQHTDNPNSTVGFALWIEPTPQSTTTSAAPIPEGLNPFGWQPIPEDTFPLERPQRPTTPCRVVAWRLDGEPVEEEEFRSLLGGLPAEMGNVVDFDMRSMFLGSLPNSYDRPIPLGLTMAGEVIALRDSDLRFAPDDMHGVVAISSGFQSSAVIRGDGTVRYWCVNKGSADQAGESLAAHRDWKDIVMAKSTSTGLAGLQTNGVPVACGILYGNALSFPLEPNENIMRISAPDFRGQVPAIKVLQGEQLLVAKRRTSDPTYESPRDGRLLIEGGVVFTLDEKGQLIKGGFSAADPSHPDQIKGRRPKDVRQVERIAKQVGDGDDSIGIAAARSGNDQWRFWGDMGDLYEVDFDYCETKAQGCWKIFFYGPYALALKPVANLKADDWTGSGASPSVTTSTMLPAATQDKPYENSLGMRFVPVPITGGPSDGQTVLFSIWETRVKDYEKFLRDDRQREWLKAEFSKDDHPAVRLTWEDAVTFCRWLTEEEQKRGKIGKDEMYRLPTDHEWSCAVGIGDKEDAERSPIEKDSKIEALYPWGNESPPPKAAGNFYGEETKMNPATTATGDHPIPIEGYNDGYERTASVGSFAANGFGIYDLGGNVRELCEDWFDPAEKKRHVLRGGGWSDNSEILLLSSQRSGLDSGVSSLGAGFRVVLATRTRVATRPTTAIPVAPKER